MWRDLWSFVKTEKKWWLIPLLATLFLLAVVLVAMASGAGAILGPLLYPF